MSVNKHPYAYSLCTTMSNQLFKILNYQYHVTEMGSYSVQLPNNT